MAGTEGVLGKIVPAANSAATGWADCTLRKGTSSAPFEADMLPEPGHRLDSVVPVTLTAQVLVGLLGDSGWSLELPAAKHRVLMPAFWFMLAGRLSPRT